MEIEGTYTLQALPEEVWRCLMDRQLLLRTIPGIEQLERIDTHTHALAVCIKLAPLIGTYRGRVIITDRKYPSYYRVVIEGEEGQQNSMSGEGVVHLNRHDGTTIITYKGTLKLGKIGTLVPSSVARGAAKLLIQQFFTSLEEQLRLISTSANDVYVAEETVHVSTVKRTSSPHAVRSKATPTMLQRVVHLLRLGSGNPMQEEQWTNRIRRVSTISALLFLVWVGTRLPRK